MGVEKEAQTRREIVYGQAALQADVNVMKAVGQREGEFLHGRGAGLADVVAADAHGVPLRDIASTKLDDIRDQADVGFGREDKFVLGVELLEDVVLERAAQPLPIDAAILSVGEEKRHDDNGRGVDRHGDGDFAEVDSVEQLGHIVEDADGDAEPADLAEARRSSASRPMRVGRSKAVLSPVWPLASRKRKHSLVCHGEPKPANWHMVQSRLRYIDAWTPRVKGY